MDPDELTRLLGILRQNGVTHYNSPDLELRIGPEPVAASGVQGAQGALTPEGDSDAGGEEDDEEELSGSESLRRFYAGEAAPRKPRTPQ